MPLESDVISAGDWRSLGRRLAFSRPAIGVLSAGDWRSLGRRLALSRPAIDVLYKGDRHYCLCFHLMPIICPCHFTPADGKEMV